MENRFGVKDVILLVLVCVLIVVVLLAMKQYDRQWDELRAIKNQSAEQTTELARIRRALTSGVAVRQGPVGPATTATTSPVAAGTSPGAVPGVTDPFFRVAEAQQQPDYATGDWLVDNLPANIAKLTPLISFDLYSRLIQRKVIETLAYIDPITLKYVPLLATGWQVSPDGLTITFQLRQGVTFSDGHPFTADDVVFSFDWMMNPRVAAPSARSEFEYCEKVVKLGEYEVAFKFKKPYFNSLETAAATLEILPKHFYSKYAPDKFNDQLGMLMGTGPYKMPDPEAWRPGKLIELVRNDRYWGEPGPFNKIVYNEVIEEVAAQTMFRNGQIDRYSAQPDEYVEMLKDKDLLKPSPSRPQGVEHMEFTSPLGGYSYIGWNQQRKGKPTPFADKRVRQAMTMLIDRERVCREVYLGYANVATGPFEPESEQADPNIKPWPYDANAAKALLDQAGFKDRNGDGVIEGADGAPFRFKLSYSNKIKLTEQAVFLIKDALAKAGIAMEPDPADWPIIQKQLTNRDFDAITLRWGGGSIEGDITQMFHTNQITDNGDNFIHYVNPELDKAIDEAKSTVDPAKRMPLWHKCHQILHEDQPYTFLTNQKYLYFFDKRIKNVKPAKLGLNYWGYNVMPMAWYVPGPMQKYKD
jgi:peptide/nickel transport system substrate-binding protein